MRRAIGAAAAAGLSWCSGSAAALEVGQAFVYSDGRVEQVRELRDTEVVWAAGNGAPFVRSLNLAAPILEWSIGERKGQRRVYGGEGLFPPKAGRRATLRVVTEIDRGEGRPPSRSLQFWSCAIGAAEEIALANGPFAALPIRCDRFAQTSAALLERRTLWWSAELEHYIKRETIDLRDGERESILLCAAVPPETSRRRINALARAKC